MAYENKQYKMNFTFKYLLSFHLIILGYLFNPAKGLSDPPITDVIEILYKGNKYYVAECFVDYGILKNHDLCYYDLNGEYMAEVYDIVYNHKQSYDSITLYSSMEKINITKLKCFLDNKSIDYFDNVLKIFRNKMTISFLEFQKNFKLVDAYHGNRGLYRYTQNLNESDNEWIDKNEIERLFCLKGHEICHYGFFTIKNKLSKREKSNLEITLKELLESDDTGNKFYEKIEKIYRDKIIMIGHCDC